MNARGEDPTFEVEWGAATHPGNRRSTNQDAHLAHRPVFLVADGMGGHRGGRQAADAVVEVFDETRWGALATLPDLHDATTRADATVRALAARDRLRPPPGSTLSGTALAAHVGQPCWLVFNLGDSRTYLLREERLEQVTVDHSEEQALIDRGWPAAQARASAGGHVITRAVGAGLPDDPAVDQWLLPALVGDRMLVCSDGLTRELDDDDIADVLRRHPGPQDAAMALVDAARDAAGRDNVTAVVVDAVDVRSGTPAAAAGLHTERPSRARLVEEAVDDTVDLTAVRDALGGDRARGGPRR